MSVFRYDPAQIPKWTRGEPLLAKNTPTPSYSFSKQEFEMFTWIEGATLSVHEPESEIIETFAGFSRLANLTVLEDVIRVFSRESSVVDIWADCTPESVYILTFMRTYDRAARDALIELEEEILDAHTNVGIDFSILALEGDDSSEIVSDLVQIYSAL